MIIKYTPETGEPELFDASKLLTSEAAIVCRTIDRQWGEVKRGILGDDPDSLRAVVWVMKKRTTPALRLSEFDPTIDQLRSQWDQREVREYAGVALAADVTDKERQEEIDRLVRNAADVAAAQAVVDELTAAQDPEASGPKEATPATGSRTLTKRS
ncbi:hypothetical protein [Streptomyces sp. SID3212]|uniref:hypothetical protein n=1 Tax=Streptomyces sp. SID3212 TaxID=2690259 RepID=UPI00136FD79A|nr:hypothetical protein [Streptomyces sp. SID3212]MYV56503.1 hypothetical protein [Streptomyces sp. SID3212]